MPTQPPRWTHGSVSKLGGTSDPIQAVVNLARQATFEAMEAGWSGPPFDPIVLAELRGIQVVPREDIKDARMLPLPSGKLQIEYNPNRPRGRVRYSIAHEIAHSFFPDCQEQIRNRSEESEMTGDDWQLEMLCNIAAAELIMPIGSFPDLGRTPVSIDDLMELRRKYDVSTEALLLRFIRLTDSPCALFAASREEAGAFTGRYRLDYAVASRTWNHPLPIGMYLRDASVVSDCTAVGYTAKGQDAWPPQDSSFYLECVGVSPFPGRSFPRVLGLASVLDERVAASSPISYVVGDATAPRGEPPQIIAHIVNDRAATWGGGFAKAVAIKYSQAQIEFRRWCGTPGNQTLGNTHFFGHAQGIEIASMVAQAGFGASALPRIRYPALEACLRAVAERAKMNSASVHMPRIGCGQAGGTWPVIGEMIQQIFSAANVPVVVYDRPT